MRTGDTGESEKRKSTFKQNRRENSPWFGLMTCHLLACTACQEDLRFLLHGVSSRGLTIPSLQLAADMAAPPRSLRVVMVCGVYRFVGLSTDSIHACEHQDQGGTDAPMSPLADLLYAVSR